MTKTFRTVGIPEAAYIAGIIDGEGSLGMSHIISKKGNYWRVHLRVGNCNKPLIEWLEQFGGYCLWDRNTNKPSRRPHHEWIVTGNHLRRILPFTYSFLIVKKQKAGWVLRVLEIQAERLSRSGQSGNPTHIKYSTEALSELESIHALFKTDREARINAQSLAN